MDSRDPRFGKPRPWDAVYDSSLYKTLMSDHYIAFVETGGYAVDYAENLARTLHLIGNGTAKRVEISAVITGRFPADTRRARAAAINAVRRAVEAYYGIELTAGHVDHSETYGFAHRTKITYGIRVNDRSVFPGLPTKFA